MEEGLPPTLAEVEAEERVTIKLRSAIGNNSDVLMDGQLIYNNIPYSIININNIS